MLADAPRPEIWNHGVEGEEEVNARNRVFMILGLLMVGSLIWYLVTARPSGDLHLIGTVDANEVR